MRNRRLKTYKLDRGGFSELLARFETAYEEQMGQPLSSSEFYERYLRGEMEGTAALLWASKYEGFLRAPERLKGSRRAAEIPEIALPRFEGASMRA
jgi:hypothetical protein